MELPVKPKRQSVPDAIAYGAELAHQDADGDGLDELHELDCDERKLRHVLLQAQIETVAQERELRTFLVKRAARRTDAILLFAAATLLFLLFAGGLNPRHDVVIALILLFALALKASSGHPGDRWTQPNSH